MAAELAFGADLARDASHPPPKERSLIDHDVDRFLQLRISPATVDRDLL